MGRKSKKEGIYVYGRGFPGDTSGKESTYQCRRCKRRGFDPWVRKIPGSIKWQPLQYACLENSMDRGTWWLQSTRSQKGDTTEWLNPCVYTVDSLCYTIESNTTLWSNYTPIKIDFKNTLECFQIEISYISSKKYTSFRD